NEGAWFWVDGNERHALNAEDARWKPGEPNNDHGVEDCAEAEIGDNPYVPESSPDQSFILEWNDASCDAPKPFICEHGS
ncbi:MAG TPA: lectin-like protein, partial [Myxococcota bacterium]|nr:lectin-like protein [Myxococcota bacterium]